ATAARSRPLAGPARTVSARGMAALENSMPKLHHHGTCGAFALCSEVVGFFTATRESIDAHRLESDPVIGTFDEEERGSCSMSTSTESSPPLGGIFGGVADAPEQCIRLIVTTIEHGLADGDDSALAVSPLGAPSRWLVVQLRL